MWPSGTHVDDLPIGWPAVKWVVVIEYPNLSEGIVYAGLCKAIATGIFDVQNNPTIMGNGCKRGGSLSQHARDMLPG
jgi:hypothetical protein